MGKNQRGRERGENIAPARGACLSSNASRIAEDRHIAGNLLSIIRFACIQANSVGLSRVSCRVRASRKSLTECRIRHAHASGSEGR